MARNEEKHYGRLNRLYLLEERKKYEKAHPTRPRLDSLQTVEEIQKWLPSIKKDLDFYLKKSQVTCYSDQHIDECREKIVKLEKEYKAFVRKIKQLSPVTTDAIPWTSRGYKRKYDDDPIEAKSEHVFQPIACPILEQEKPKESKPPILFVNIDLMDKPLCFNKTSQQRDNLKSSIDSLQRKSEHSSLEKYDHSLHVDQLPIAPISTQGIVAYEYSSDSDCG